jgi:hypothetical protein
MMGFELRPHDRQVALHPTDPSIADRFLEVIVRLHLEKSLEPDVLEAAGDALRVLRAEETNRAAADPEADLPLTGSRAFRASAPMPSRSSRMARSRQWDSALAPHRFCRLDPNNLMIIREGLVRGRVVAVATAVWVSYVLLLALAMTFGGTANA